MASMAVVEARSWAERWSERRSERGSLADTVSALPRTAYRRCHPASMPQSPPMPTGARCPAWYRNLAASLP
ncbi:hypothetical protein WH91_07145 [Devosia psychrophila]|uniref:Uncharacterized protein n=1 Tax=Devosia psychrophila TaxID=728005 RepID=A0ABR5E0V1_9HYPH|nr:hypothetical protein WH91_07145 [Devosia psychrophila]